MGIEVKLPDLGEGIESGDVLDVLVSEGDTVAKDQSILELETDKATVEVPSSHAGRISRVHVSAGQTVSVGAVLLTLEAAGVSAPSPQAGRQPPVASRAEPEEPTETDAPMPHHDTASADTPKGAASPREDQVERGPQHDPRTAAPAAEKNAPRSPAPVVPAPRPSGRPAAATRIAATTSPAQEQPPQIPATAPIPAGPAIRRFAREVGVDLQGVQGSGEGGRITREDVLAVVRGAKRAAGASPTDGSPAAHVSRVPAAEDAASQDAPENGGEITSGMRPTGEDAWGAVHVERASKIRRTIASKMFESWSTVPRVTNFDDADVTELEQIRKASKKDYAGRGIKLTSLPFVVKAVATALRQNPVLNATFDPEHEQVTYKSYINIGLAVDTDRGLVVPVLRNCDQMSIWELAQDIAATAERVRDKQFSVDDLRGGTFTVSNLGAIGGTYSTPMINVPEVAILLVGRARKMPVVVDDRIVPRLMMPLSLSYDHRLVDGAAAARFLNDVIGYLQAPARLLLAP